MSDGCPICGSTVVYQGLSAVECEGKGCGNNPKKFDWRGFLMSEITHELLIAPIQTWALKADKSKPPDPKAVKAFIDHLKRNDVT